MSQIQCSFSAQNRDGRESQIAHYDVLEYVSSMLKELGVMASSSDLGEVSYLIEIARLASEDLKTRRSGMTLFSKR